MRQFAYVVAAAGAVLACAAAQGQSNPNKRMPGAFFSEMQEIDPFTPEQMAERRTQMGDDDERIATDLALNDWKICVIDAVGRWVVLRPGPGTIADAAMGRCSGLARDYRQNLVKIKFDGRSTVDVQTARTMARSLEEIWRPRLIAAALDQELAGLRPAGTVSVVPTVTKR